MQVVLKNYARDLDLLDRTSNQRPVSSAGKLQPSTSEQSAGQDACETHASLCALRLTKRVRSVDSRKHNRGALPEGRATAPPAQQQKEYQWQES
jgi:hypothetical protein